jgi:6-phosphofructokinase 1
MNITSLGEARFPSPIAHTVSDQARIPAVIVRDPAAPKRDEVLFELAGPRAKLFFDPAKTRAGIVTCGGLCPGLNNVIRALFLELHIPMEWPRCWGSGAVIRVLIPRAARNRW